MSGLNAALGVDKFTIKLKKPAYFAGEVVHGTVKLETSKKIKCRSIKFRIVGEGFSFFWYRYNKEDHQAVNTQEYFRETHTLWGRFHRTEVISGGEWLEGSNRQGNQETLLVRIGDA